MQSQYYFIEKTKQNITLIAHNLVIIFKGLISCSSAHDTRSQKPKAGGECVFMHAGC